MERLVELEKMTFEDSSDEVTLRARVWDYFIGLEKFKKILQVIKQACTNREQV